jgi:hypothetical protein
MCALPAQGNPVASRLPATQIPKVPNVTEKYSPEGETCEIALCNNAHWTFSLPKPIPDIRTGRRIFAERLANSQRLNETAYRATFTVTEDVATGLAKRSANLRLGL